MQWLESYDLAIDLSPADYTLDDHNSLVYDWNWGSASDLFDMNSNTGKFLFAYANPFIKVDMGEPRYITDFTMFFYEYGERYREGLVKMIFFVAVQDNPAHSKLS